ncbi:MAG: Cna B-type domain-containing protein [Solobacterium sp.]|nr:Cna B-type domain-containing protein [Solobacterium sp.]
MPNGTRGNLTLTVKHIEIETSFTVDAEHPRVLEAADGSTYSYDKAVVLLQTGNDMLLTTDCTDDEGNFITQDEAVVKTADEIRAHFDAAKAGGSNISQANIDGSAYDTSTRGATGTHIDVDIKVTDVDGNTVNGIISYAAKDLDLADFQNVWGRAAEGDARHNFAEGLEIVSGSKSYALVPYYNHAEGATLKEGWVPVGPYDAPTDSPLNISGGGSGNADGTNFRAGGIVKPRDKDGNWTNALFRVTTDASANHEIITISNGVPYPGQGILERPYIDTTLGWSPRAQLAGLVSDPTTGEIVPSTNDVTAEMALKYLGDGSWATQRADKSTFDSGFAVLLDSSGSSLRWSASTQSHGAVVTNLFDTTIFTYVETTHGTGGGIYLESYDLLGGTCDPQMNEGTTTMGRNSDATVTAVPEDGYRVNRILIGNTNYGKSSTTPGLQNYKAYYIDGNVLKDENGNELGRFEGDTDISGFAGLKTGKIEITGFDYDDKGNQREIEGKFVFERNADGTVDITLPNVDNPMHVHVDFGADWHFYKVWVDEEPTALNMTVAPADFYPTKVTLPVPTGEYDEELKPITQPVTFNIDGEKYTATDGTYNGQSISGYVFTLTSNNMIEYVEVDGTGTETLAIRPNVVLLGNEFVHYTSEQEIDERYPVTLEERIASWESQDAKNFTVNGTETDYVTVDTDADGNTVWKIRYPSEGVESLNWPAIPVEREPENDNHDAMNHSDRYYWFVIEEVPGWATESYSNENAEIPGKVSDTRYHDSIWYQSTIKDRELAQRLVHEEYDNASAYLSVFEDGGEIANVPALVVRGRKVWVDQENEYNNRKDIWLHIDATIKNADGSTTVKQDVLPAQKVGKDATGEDLIKTWGDKVAYDTGDATIKVVSAMKNIPSDAELQADGSYKADNTYYWINELKKMNKDKVPYEYTIRETLDREGSQPVEKDNPDEGLLGYTSDDTATWEELKKSEDTTTVMGKEVVRYTGDVTNTLKRITYEATKVWDDNNNQDGYREDVTFVLMGLDTLPDSQEKEKLISADNDTTTVTWTNLPKYKDGKLVQYNVLEEGLNQEYYSLSYHVEEDLEGNFKDTFTNIHIPETASISIFKKWDDAENQDNLRKEAAKVLLEGKTDSESQYRSVVDQDGQGITQGLVPVEDGLVITWLNIPVKRNGEDITYKIYEDINGLGGYYTDPTYVDETFTLTNGENKEATITNKETPELTEVTITKEWDDMDDHDGIRPDSITVQLVKTYQKLQETTEPAKKQVTVNGEKYDVKVAADGTEYFEINGQYYRGDEIKEVDGDVTNYEHLIPFNPDDTGEVLQEGKFVEVDGESYPVKVTGDGVEYYEKEEQYYSPEGDVLVPGEDEFNPTAEDEYVFEDLVIEIDGTEYQVKLGNLDGEEQWYYEKDGQYYDIFGNELIKFVPSADDEVVQINVAGEPEYEETVEKTDVELTAAENWTTTITDLNVNEPVGQPVVYSVEEENVPEGYSVTITSTEAGKFTVNNKHEVIINPPTAEPDETIDYKGKPQTGTPTFKADPDTKAPGGGENKIERITLLDDDGNEVDTVTVPGEGTYKLNEDGTITFTPEPEFVGKTSGVKVRGYDSNNLSADTTYTPTVIVKVSYVDPITGETVQGPEDSTVPGGTDITTTYEDTPGQESKNHPGYRFDGWDETIDPEDPSHIIRTAKYTPMYSINYDPNGGTGNMPDNNYAADDPTMPHDQNTFTRKGYTFTGFKAYITDPTTGEETPILDESGNPIIFQNANDMKEYFKDMPGGTSIRMEAQWKRNEYHIHYDPNGGSGTMTSQDFTGDDTKAVSKENEFTRGGYYFTGFLAVTKDGKVLGVFSTPADFLKYLEEQGDGGEVTLIAQWAKVTDKVTPGQKGRTCQDDGYPAGYYWSDAAQKCIRTGGVPTPYTGDNFHIWLWISLLCGAIVLASGSSYFLKRSESK